MSLKSMEIDYRIEPMFVGLIRKAEPALEKALGEFADRVEVTWEAGSQDAEGEPRVRLSLTDDEVCRSADFTAWDLEDDFWLPWSFRRLWD